MTGSPHTSYARHGVDLRESRLRKLMDLLAAERPGRLLDVGCAAGELAGQAMSLGWRVDGVEREPALAHAARARGVAVHLGDFDVARLPWERATFDAAIAGEVIEHLVDTDHFLAEMARVVRPGGVVIVTTPNLASFENRVRLFFGRYPMWMDHRVAGTGHLRYYTPRVLRAQLAAHGLHVERHVGNWVPIVPQRWADDRRFPWLAVTGDWWPSLAMGIVMKARRVAGGPA